MYHFIEDKQDLMRAQSLATEIAMAVQDQVREDGISCQVFLIGSGARNLVTANNNEPFDFDFNLSILKYDNWGDGRTIKETVRKSANKVMREYGLNDFQDSTSSLTSSEIYFKDQPGLRFSIDIGIVTQDANGLWNRLIHEKTGFSITDKYYWNEVRNSKGVSDKAAILKKNNHWENVRQRYLKIKNKYLRANDYNHPSFVCYVEAVNEIYQKFGKK